MAALDKDGTEYVELDADDATLLGKDQWIVGGQPQFVGRWIQDEVGEHVGDQGEFMLGHGCIYSTALDRPLQRLDSVILERFGKPCGFMVPGACRSRPGSRWRGFAGGASAMHQARLTGSELMDGGKGEEKAPRALAPPIQDMAAVIQAVALDGFPQPNRMPAVAFANEHAKHPGIGIVRHRQHSASEIAHHIGQIGVTARQHKGI